MPRLARSPCPLANAPCGPTAPHAALIERFDVAGPRYTSYPTADRFVEAYDDKIVTKDRERGRAYVADLLREVELYGERLGRREPVGQIHFGGGTPTFLDGATLQSVIDGLERAIAMVFDRYLRSAMQQGSYSRVL
jgi:oxygen-independent coproporphyrinogen-3 oxidase